MNLPISPFTWTSKMYRTCGAAAAFCGGVHQINKLATNNAGVHDGQTLITLTVAWGALNFLFATSLMSARKTNKINAISPLPGAAMGMTTLMAITAQVYKVYYVPHGEREKWLVVTIDVSNASPLARRALRAVSVGRDIISAAASAVIDTVRGKHEPTDTWQVKTVELNLPDLLTGISTHVIPTIYIVALTARHVLYLKKDFMSRKFSMHTLSDLVMLLPGFYHVSNHGVWLPCHLEKAHKDEAVPSKIVTNLNHFNEHGGILADSRMMHIIRKIATAVEPYGDKMISLVVLFQGFMLFKPMYLFFLVSPYLPKYMKDEARNWIGDQIISLGKFIAKLVHPQGKDFSANNFGLSKSGSNLATPIVQALIHLGRQFKTAGVRTPIGLLNAHQRQTAEAAKKMLEVQSTESPVLSPGEAQEATGLVLRSSVVAAESGNVDTMNLLGARANVPIGQVMDKISGELIRFAEQVTKQVREALTKSLDRKTGSANEELLTALIERLNSLLLTVTSDENGLALPSEMRVHRGILENITDYLKLPEGSHFLTKEILEQDEKGENTDSSYAQLKQRLNEYTVEGNSSTIRVGSTEMTKPDWFKFFDPTVRKDFGTDLPKSFLGVVIDLCKTYPAKEKQILASTNAFFLALHTVLEDENRFQTMLDTIKNNADHLEALSTGGKCAPRTEEMLTFLGKVGLAMFSENVDLALFLVDKQETVTRVRREVFTMQMMTVARMLSTIPDGLRSLLTRFENTHPYEFPELEGDAASALGCIDASILVELYLGFFSVSTKYLGATANENSVNIHYLNQKMGKEAATIDQKAEAARLNTIAQARVMQKLVRDLIAQVHDPAVEFISYTSLLKAFTPHFTEGLLTRDVKKVWTDQDDQKAVITAALAIKEREADLAIYKQQEGYDETRLQAWQWAINEAKTAFDAFVQGGAGTSSEAHLKSVIDALFHPLSTGQLEGYPPATEPAKLSEVAAGVMSVVNEQGHLAARATILLKLAHIEAFQKKRELRFFHDVDTIAPHTLDPIFFWAMGLSPKAASELHAMPEHTLLQRLEDVGEGSDFASAFMHFSEFTTEADVEKAYPLTDPVFEANEEDLTAVEAAITGAQFKDAEEVLTFKRELQELRKAMSVKELEEISNDSTSKSPVDIARFLKQQALRVGMDAGELGGIIDGTTSKSPEEVAQFLKETATNVQAAVKEALDHREKAAGYVNFRNLDELVAFQQTLRAGELSVDVGAINAAIAESGFENIRAVLEALIAVRSVIDESPFEDIEAVHAFKDALEVIQEEDNIFTDVAGVLAFQQMLKVKAEMWYIALEQRKKQLQKAFDTYLTPAVLTHLRIAKPDTEALEERAKEERVGAAFSNVCRVVQNHVEPQNLRRAQEVFKALLTGDPMHYLDFEGTDTLIGADDDEVDVPETAAAAAADLSGSTDAKGGEGKEETEEAKKEVKAAKALKTMQQMGKLGLNTLIGGLVRGLVMETDSFKVRDQKRKDLGANGEDFTTLLLSDSEVKTIMRQLSQVLGYFSMAGFLAPKLSYIRAVLDAGYPATSLRVPMEMQRVNGTTVWVPSLKSQEFNLEIAGSHGDRNAETNRQLRALDDMAHALKMETPAVFTLSMSMIYALGAAGMPSKVMQDMLRILQARGEHQEHEESFSSEVWLDEISKLKSSDHANPNFSDRCDKLMAEIANQKRGGSFLEIAKRMGDLMNVLMEGSND